jgi:HAE1 family hydrophobic/amphiphilic exporter-1
MVQVTTTFVGAGATDVETAVATPLEQKINGVENMIYMKSTNANDGTLTLKVSFDVGTNLDMANVLTQNRVSEATPQLPQSVKNYGVSVKKALAFPLLVISIKSPNGTYDSNFLSNYATININDNIARIRGVGQINLFGGSDYAMRVWLRPDRIANLGVTGTRHRQRHQSTEPAEPGRPDRRAAGESRHGVHLRRPDARPVAGRRAVRRHHHPLESGWIPGSAEGRRTPRARHAAVQRHRRHDGKPSAVIAVFQIPGTNALAVANEIKKTMEDLKSRFRRIWTTASHSTRHCPSPKASTRSCTRSPKPSSW